MQSGGRGRLALAVGRGALIAARRFAVWMRSIRRCAANRPERLVRIRDATRRLDATRVEQRRHDSKVARRTPGLQTFRRLDPKT
ncbi:hypothetical protein BSIN_4281 [Burkholderia singularis]|uniref:Uncharacterized protein n=1 Tax=Burkholderia singularis TaxID=1503053 RepID=A0A238H7E0_9BURK|nr:hypothetical protein BSIN_4281 [Burkholderia singularis]